MSDKNIETIAPKAGAGTHERTYYCDTCGGLRTGHVEHATETLTIRGEEITAEGDAMFCDVCGSRVDDGDLETSFLQKFFDACRAKHDIPSAADIRAIRERYGLTQRALGTLLGWGDVSVHRYESGSIPDDAHAQVLKFIKDPWNMNSIALENDSRLTAPARKRLRQHIDVAMNDEMPERIFSTISSQDGSPSVFNGFKRFSPEALEEMTLFFASRAGGVYKTKLLKLLWYADFYHYREQSTSISGATYCALPYGPVPNGYSIFLDQLFRSGVLEDEEVYLDNGNVGERIKANREADLSILAFSERRILELVWQKFAAVSAVAISERSHKEAAWEKTPALEPIAYSYADQFSEDLVA